MGTRGIGGGGRARPVHTALIQAAALARCSHPEPVLVVTAAASLLAAAAGRGPGTLWLTGAIFTGQLSVGWSNDWLDRRLDAQASRKDKPLVAGTVPTQSVGYGALAALAACLPLSFAYGIAAGAVHLVALACAFIYNLGLKATPASILPYAAAFGLLPVIVSLGLSPSHLPPPWAIGAGALLGCAGHFAQVLSDIPTDRRLGFRGLPHLIGRQWSAIATAVLLLGATALVTFGPQRVGALQLAALGLAALFAAGIIGATQSGRPKFAYLLLLGAALVAVLNFGASGTSL